MSTMTDISFVPKGVTNNFPESVDLTFQTNSQEIKELFLVISGQLPYLIPPPRIYISKVVSITKCPPSPAFEV